MIVITDEEINSLHQSIHTRYGIDFSNYEINSFRRRLARILSKYGMESSMFIWRKLLQDKDFLPIFIDEISVGLTEMFRNADFWIFLREQVLKNNSLSQPFDIWHVGCSSGEEVFSMVIWLEEAGLLPFAKLTATDMSQKSLNQAQTGQIPDFCWPKYSQNYLDSKGKYTLSYYFSAAGGNYQLKPHLLKKIIFKNHNISKDVASSIFQIIFCRNVMIYFDDVLKLRALELFYNALPAKGLLVIGYYDALPDGYKKWFELVDARTKIYQKKG